MGGKFNLPSPCFSECNKMKTIFPDIREDPIIRPPGPLTTREEERIERRKIKIAVLALVDATIILWILREQIWPTIGWLLKVILSK